MVFFWVEYLNPANCHLRAECEWTEKPRFPRGCFVDGTVIRCGKKEMVGGKLPRATMARRRHGANKGTSLPHN